MKRLYLLRHGESQWNREKRLQGSKDSELTELGIEQAKKAGLFLKNQNIDSIYSGNLKRARVTANTVGDELGIESKIRNNLTEMCFGCLEGKKLEELQKSYLEDLMKWKREPQNFKVEGSETLEETKKRMLNELKNIESEDNSENILIVSHGTALKSLILGLLGIDLSKYLNFTMSNTGITLIELDEINNIMRYFNSISHLGK